MQSKLFCSVSERYNPIIEMPNKPVPPGKKRKAFFVSLSFNVNKFKYTFNKPPIYKTRDEYPEKNKCNFNNVSYWEILLKPVRVALWDYTFREQITITENEAAAHYSDFC